MSNVIQKAAMWVGVFLALLPIIFYASVVLLPLDPLAKVVFIGFGFQLLFVEPLAILLIVLSLVFKNKAIKGEGNIYLSNGDYGQLSDAIKGEQSKSVQRRLAIENSNVHTTVDNTIEE